MVVPRAKTTGAPGRGGPTGGRGGDASGATVPRVLIDAAQRCLHPARHYPGDPVPPSRLRILSAARLLPVLLLPCCYQYRVKAVATELLQPLLQFRDLQPRELEVQFHRGLLLLESGDELHCDLKIDLTARSLPELAQLRNQVQPSIVESDGKTSVSVELPRGAGLEALQTVYTLQVPSQTRVVVTTREGAVTVRGFRGNVDVHGGSGDLDVQLDGGSARLDTVAGSMQLRGVYRFADLRTDQGRIDLSLPPVGLALDLAVQSRSGEVFVDMQSGQNIDVQYRGEIEQVHSDPEVRVLWQEVRDQDGVELHVGSFGDPAAPLDGRMLLATDAAVTLRLSPTASQLGG